VINTDTFRGDTALSTINMPSSLNAIGAAAFYQTRLTSLQFPEGFTSVGASAFRNNTKLASISFPSTIQTIGADAFNYTDLLATITVGLPTEIPADTEFAGYFTGANGTGTQLTDGSGTGINLATWKAGNFTLHTYFVDNRFTIAQIDGTENYRITGYSALAPKDVVVPSMINGHPITEIGPSAFTLSGITSISIPASVTTIGASAFYGLSTLTAVTFVGTGGLETIGETAFRASAIQSITIPATVTNIGTMAFSATFFLTEVVFAEGSVLETIGNGAFYGSAFARITIPATVTNIGEKAFSAMQHPTEIVFMEGSGLETLGNEAFDSGDTVYFCGSQVEWNAVTNHTAGSNGAVVYFYSATPSAGAWHYNEAGNPVLWP
jgi:hypothetical protein